MKLVLAIILAIPTYTHAVTADQVKTILQRNNCMGCHASGSSSGDFQSIVTDDQWAASRFIVPGDKDSSSLIYRLKNYGNSTSINNMPRGGSALSSADYNQLIDYVNGLKSKDSGTEVADGDTETQADIGMDLQSIKAQKIVFKRCYEQMVREPLDPSSYLFKEVAKGERTASNACISLLRQARLSQNGQTRFYDSGEAQKVFNTFYDFHVSWFGPRNLTSSVGFDASRQDSIHDVNQPAYYLMKALFGDNIPYSYVLTSNESLKSIRSTNEKYINNIQFRYPKKQHVTKGQVKGISKHYAEYVGRERGPVRQGSTRNGNFNVFHHQGAGILGSQSYLLLNAGERLPYRTNGGLRTMRTLSKNFFSQVLCRELPAVRLEDAISNVASDESNLPYRNGVACMQCHSTIDPFAWATRKIYSTLSDGTTFGQDRMDMRTLYIGRYDGDEINSGPVTEWPDNSPGDFYRRSAWGKLFYRSFDGTLVDEEVKGFSELGEALSQQDAPYVCAAKRYFQFFTGVDANIGDIDHILSETELTEKERYYRNFVIKLGKELKEHQNLETMFKRIFSSKAYAAPGLGVE
ncbi:MAG: hypothetical protein CME63_16605 [Halobacteriovoraceae bacterium]|nr:hypothetical protein [Halobacteriovoraceae bacterium]